MEQSNQNQKPAAIYSVIAAVIALIGLADSAYLTAKHFSGTAVPCSVVSGCETVLTSSYSEIFGIPTAAFGALAYFVAFSVALFVYFGNLKLWIVFGLVSLVMFLFSVWLVYLQAFVIGSFCQYCLLSALSSTSLFIVYMISILRKNRRLF
ncbi:MAG: vitamin K epoxide reductase family protein [Pyrinomonadaceae bacterium]